MSQIQEQFITDKKGKKKAIIIPISQWEDILDELEELEDIRAYDKAKSKPSQPIDFKEAINQIASGE